MQFIKWVGAVVAALAVVLVGAAGWLIVNVGSVLLMGATAAIGLVGFIAYLIKDFFEFAAAERRKNKGKTP